MAQRRVVILGGGMAALAAAYELSRPSVQAEYDITLFQPGWALGGKCASVRRPHPFDATSLRVEEHGLHVWFGFYFNAFHMMHDCYGTLGDPRLQFQALFRRRSSTPLMEQHPGAGQWKLWPLTFPEDPPAVQPGVTPGFPSLADVLRRALGFYSAKLDEIAGLVQQNGGLLSAPLVGQLLGLAAAVPVLPPVLPPEAELQLLDTFLDFTTLQWQGLLGQAQAVVPGGLKDNVRRAWLYGDIALAVVNGLRKDFVAVATAGFSVLDNRDFRQWLRANGASPASVDSAPIRALYDLCFAYTDGNSNSFASADFAAGTALRTIVRISLGYSGAVCYSMDAGMGEAVLAPLYKLLKLRGVKFRFFHRADRIELDAAGIPVKLHFTRQAAVKNNAEYQPLKTAGGLSYWPARPDFTQLDNEGPLEQQFSEDMEDETVAWQGQAADSLDLRTTGDPVDLVLAIAPGSLSRVTGDLAARHPQWQTMLAKTRTVATQSAQLWLKKDLAGLQYPQQVPPAMIAAPEPMDVWADMSAVVGTEGWAAAKRPASVQYLCGPLAGDFASRDQALQAVMTHTGQWLDTMANSLWPGGLQGAGFDASVLVAAGAGMAARLGEQHLRANDKGSQRYVLSVTGSMASRLRPDAFKAHRLFLAGDWTFNGLNAGCVEAAVMSGKQAAFALQGLRPVDVPGSVDFG